MKVNYDQKYVNPNKQTNGVKQFFPSRPAEESNLKAYYQAQSQSRLKVQYNNYLLSLISLAGVKVDQISVLKEYILTL